MDLFAAITNFDADDAGDKVTELLDECNVPEEHRESSIRRFLGMCIVMEDLPTWETLKTAMQSISESARTA